MSSKAHQKVGFSDHASFADNAIIENAKLGPDEQIVLE
jgi:hypothetical protein